MRQGCCVLPPDDQGRVCDRLAGLEQVIDLETIRQVLQERGRLNPRACKLPHEVVLWVVLAMGIFTNVPIRQVFKRTRFARAGEDSPCRSSLCHARQRLGVALYAAGRNFVGIVLTSLAALICCLRASLIFGAAVRSRCLFLG